MNKSNAKYFLPIVQALIEGKDIQYKNYEGKWVDISGEKIGFGLPPEYYRIKPEPRKIYVNVYTHGTMCFHKTKKEADNARTFNRIECVEFIEVV